MKVIQDNSCPCSENKDITDKAFRPVSGHLFSKTLLLGVGIGLWFIIYRQLYSFSSFLTYTVFSLNKGSHLGEAVHFFLYDTPKVLMLLTLVIFGVGLVRTFFTPERTRRILAGKKESVGNVMSYAFISHSGSHG
jgi:hypothetical protein